MPIYEYQCQSCGRRSEVLQRMDEAPLTTCSECGGPLKKLLSSPAVQFKGSGWYVTDYGKGGSKAGAAGKSGSGEGGKSEGRSESKSDSGGKSDGGSSGAKAGGSEG